MCQVVIFEPKRLVREGLARLLAEGGYQVVDSPTDDVLAATAAGEVSVDLVLTEVRGTQSETDQWIDRIADRYPRARIVLLTEGPAHPEEVRRALASGAHGYVGKDVTFATLQAVIGAVLHGQMVYPSSIRNHLLPPGASPPSNGPGDHDGRARDWPAAASQDQRSETGSENPPARPTLVQAIRPAAQAVAPRQARPLPAPAPADAGTGAIGLSEREAEILHHLAQGHPNKMIAYRLSISEATVKAHLKNLLRKLRFSNRTQAAIWALSNAGTRAGAAICAPATDLPPHAA